MAPKRLLRPAAVLGPGVKAKAKANGRARGRGDQARLRRPARADESGDRGEDQLSENFEKGLEVECGLVPVAQWKIGDRLVITEGHYWEEKVKIAGLLKGIDIGPEGVMLRMRLEGTQSEAMVKWAGAHPGRMIEVHPCLPDCGRLSKDGLLHATKVKKLLAGAKEDWMENVVDLAVAQGEGEDELARLRERAKERGHAAVGEQRAPVVEKADALSSSSEERRKKKKKKKKERKKKEEGEKQRVSATKDLTAVFGGTALDPQPSVRRKIKKKAKRSAKRKSRRSSSSTSSTSRMSSASGEMAEDSGHLFGEEVKMKTLAKKYPGALTLSTLEQIQTAVVSQTGQPWELSRESLPPIFSQFWRQMLSPKMSGPMSREAQTLCYLQDLLLQGRIAATCDTITQRLKGLEQVAGGSHYQVAQRQELVPIDSSQMTSPMESLEASRLQREEAKARAAAARPWARGSDWERRAEEPKGKAKGKDAKSRGKGKGDKGGLSKEERDKEKR